MQFDTFTWVRLTLGQWLLVASSDSSTSAISLWRTSSNLTENSAGPPWQKPSYRLQSLMDSSTLRITTFHCSQPSKKVCIRISITCTTAMVLTMTRTPWVALLTLTILIQRPVFQELAAFSDISYVRFLRGSYMGFALDHEIASHQYLTGPLAT